MAGTLKFEIITPDGTAYSEEVDMVTLPGVEGQMGVFPQHVPLMTQMVPGEMIVRKDGQEYFLAVGEGLIEVTGDHVAVLTDLAIEAGAINEAKVEEARQRALARLQVEGELSRKNVAAGGDPAEERVILESWTDWYLGALDAMADLEAGGPSPTTRSAIEGARERVAETGRRLVEELRGRMAEAEGPSVAGQSGSRR